MKLDEFKKNKESWDKHEKNKKGNPPPLKSDGTPYRSAPVKPIMETKVVKCCCDKFWCSNGQLINGRVVRECPIDCKQPDGTHYPIVAGLCTCPLCSSNCNLAHPFGMSFHINVTERALKAGKIDFNSSIKKEKEKFMALLTQETKRYDVNGMHVDLNQKMD